MALRSLDNNRLNSIQQQQQQQEKEREEDVGRPKKMAKKAPTALASPADATCRPSPDPDDATSVVVGVDYVNSADLKPVEQPEIKIKTLLEELDSKDWTRQCEALNDARRFALHHSPLLLPILDKVLLVLVKSMKNPRSALCKTSIMASIDILGSFGHALPPVNVEEAAAFDQLLLQLLIKASQDKKFVCEEAEKALHKMARCAIPIPLLGKLQSYVKHTNLRVRAKAAVTISTCVSKMGHTIMKEFGLVTLLQIAAQLLNDRLPEARESARSIANEVHGAFASSEDEDGLAEDDAQRSSCGLENWQSFCLSSLPPISAHSVVKITSQQ